MTPEKVAATETLLESFGCSIIDAEQRLITCPGKSLHTTANADADCKVFLNDNGSVRLYCHHKSCREVIKDANRRLAAIHKPRNKKRRRRSIPGLDRERLTKQARRELLDKFAWPYDKIIADSDDAIWEPVEEHYYQISGLFADEDIVCCGRGTCGTQDALDMLGGFARYASGWPKPRAPASSLLQIRLTSAPTRAQQRMCCAGNSRLSNRTRSVGMRLARSFAGSTSV
jgi:hypothetical protein